VSVCRGGRRLAKRRHALDRDDVAFTEEGWRLRWQAARRFLAADGEADKRWGNETIRVHPDEHWLELRLPPRWRTWPTGPTAATDWRARSPSAIGAGSGPRRPVAARSPTTCGAIRPGAAGMRTRAGGLRPGRHRRLPRCASTGRWGRPERGAPGRLGAYPAGDPLGPPHTIPLNLDGLPTSTRDGRLRAAVATIIRLATQRGCRSVIVEDLDVADARQAGRETLGRGRHGRRFRRTVAGMPTRAVRQALVGMAANAGLWVVAVDPAWTSKWAGYYWEQPLNQQTRQSTSPPAAATVSNHHAAAVVIGRRGLGYRARRRGGCARARPEDRARRAADSAGRPTATTMPSAMPQAWRLVVPGPAIQGTGGPGGQRAGPSAHHTRLPERGALGDQAAHDRSVPPEGAGSHPLPP
jgi:hypothetical protein